jgi:predicted enzyme related to lactoylglutathione lyase
MEQKSPFCWIELAAPDADVAKKFYGDLFGWTTSEMPMGGGHTYTMWHLAGEEKPFGGLLPLQIIHEMAPGVPAHWAQIMAVNDVEGFLNKIVSHGGHVLRPPFDIPGVGRLAVVTDDGGAMFQLLQPSEPSPPPKSPVVWYEIFHPSQDAAVHFYGSVFGFDFSEMDMGDDNVYKMLKMPGEEKAFGGIVQLNPETMPGVPPTWAQYVGVDSVDDVCSRLPEYEGTVMVPAFDIPGVGRTALIADPFGAPFYIYESSSALA